MKHEHKWEFLSMTKLPGAPFVTHDKCACGATRVITEGPPEPEIQVSEGMLRAAEEAFCLYRNQLDNNSLKWWTELYRAMEQKRREENASGWSHQLYQLHARFNDETGARYPHRRSTDK